ncbi:hypothetical protein [Desulfomarina sp.]
MRCPKCGYISFDYLEVCRKCKKNIKEVADQLQGGVLAVNPPSFLNLDLNSDRESEDSLTEEYGDSGEELTEHDDFLDADLEVLFTEDSDREVELEPAETEPGEDEEDGFEISLDTDEDGLSIDLDEEDVSLDFDTDEGEITVESSEIEENEADQDTSGDFQLVDGEDEFEAGEGDELAIELPDELADLSDLAPPASTGEMDPVTDLDSLEISLDGLELDLGVEKPAVKEILSPDEEEIVLSLDEIDFSDVLDGVEKEQGPKTKMMDMDADLDFDLDLGGLSIHDDL